MACLPTRSSHGGSTAVDYVCRPAGVRRTQVVETKLLQNLGDTDFLAVCRYPLFISTDTATSPTHLPFERATRDSSSAIGRANARGWVGKRRHGRSEHVEAGSCGLPQTAATAEAAAVAAQAEASSSSSSSGGGGSGSHHGHARLRGSEAVCVELAPDVPRVVAQPGARGPGSRRGRDGPHHLYRLHPFLQENSQPQGAKTFPPFVLYTRVCWWFCRSAP